MKKYRIRIQELNSGELKYYPEFSIRFEDKSIFRTKITWSNWHSIPGTIIRQALVCDSEKKALEELKNYHSTQTKSITYKNIEL